MKTTALALRLLAALFMVSMVPGCDCGSGGPDGGSNGEGGGSGGGTGGGSGGGSGGGAGGGSGGGAGGGTGGGTGGGSGGTCSWERTFTSPISDIAYAVVALPDQSVVVVGVAGLAILDAGLAQGGFAARFDQQGALVWTRSYGATATPNSVQLASDGTLLLSGYATTDAGCRDFHGAPNQRDVWISRVSVADGQPLMTTCIGGDDDDEPFAVRETTLPDGGAALHVTGSTDSHVDGDIGPKHGGGGVNAPDMLNAFLRETDGGRVVTASCQGSLGPDDGRGFLDDGSIVGNTFGANDGDLTGQALPAVSADLWVARWPGGQLCSAQTCSVVATRIGGNLGDAIFGSLPGDLVYGTTRSDDGGVACPGATQTNAQPWVAKWGAAGLEGMNCATNVGNARVEDAFLAQGSLWMVGNDVGTNGVFADAGVFGSGMGVRGFIYAVDAPTHQNVTRVLRVAGDLIYGAAMRPDGCLVVVGSQGGNARVLTVPP